jgi:hypothetical protein
VQIWNGNELVDFTGKIAFITGAASGAGFGQAQVFGRAGVLCPMNINSNIGLSSEARPAHLRPSGYVVDDATKASLQRLFAHGMDPVELAGHVKAGIERNELYIIPYPEAAAPLKQHFDDVLRAVPPEQTDPEGVAKRTAALRNWAPDRDEIASRRSDQAAPEVRSAPWTTDNAE